MDKNVLIKQNIGTSTINIDWIRYFVVFSENGSTADAAKLLNISQQALIKAITGLEHYLKVDLVERKRHFKGLTKAGLLFLDKSRNILQNFYDIDKCFYELKNEPVKGSIRIGYTTLWETNILPSAFVNFIDHLPNSYPKLYQMSQTEIEKWLASGELDLGLLSKKPEKNVLEFLELKENPWILVGNPKYLKKDLEFKFIKHSLFNLDKTDSPERPWFFFNSLNESEIKFNVIGEADTFQDILSFCEEGAIIALVPEIVARKKIANGKLVKISEQPYEKFSNLTIAWNKNIHLNKLMSAFINEIKNVLKQKQG